jgi:ABC-type Fe3+ transport system substrate-binding protein
MRAKTFLVLLALAGCAGCGQRGPEPLQLVLISPHRDEIREEVARGFQGWFAQRTTDRRASARSLLQAWLDRPDAERQVMTDRACRSLFADWSPDDLGNLPALLAAWQQQPTPENGRALLAALDEWNGPARPLTLVWQDVGGGTAQIAKYVGARFEQNPQGIGIDLLFGGGTDIYVRFADQGLLQPLDLKSSIENRIRPELNGVPLYDAKGRWFGPMLSSFGILCNKDVFRRTGKGPLPQSWTDLGRAELRSWVSCGDPRLTGSVHMVFEIILQGEGWDDGFRLLLRLGANTHTFIRDSGTLTRTVVLGEVAAAGNVDVNALSAVGRNPHMMEFVLPKVRETVDANGRVIRSGGTIINPDAIAVLKGTRRPELARAFVEFTLSDAGQKLFLLLPGQPGGPRRYPLCRLSVVEALYKEYPPDKRSVGAADPFTQKNALRYDSHLGQQRWDALNDLIGTVIVDAQDDLSAAWKAVVESSLRINRLALEQELFQPPCTEAELMAHARRIVEQGPRARAAQINQWGEDARSRYRAIRARAGGGW